jgi:ABC-type antimicrobial peptide transport system permease subunit
VIEQSGFPITYEFVPQPVGLAVLIGLGIAVLGGIIPAHRAATVDIVEAIGYE